MSDDINRASEKFGEALDSLFEIRASAVAAIRNLQAAARVTLQSEVARVEQRYGADDPRTARMKSRLETNKTALRALEVESELVGIRVAQPVEGELLIEGRVADPQGRGIASLRVTLVDEKRERIRGVESASTQTGGYFAVRLKQTLAAKLLETQPHGVFPGVFSERGTILHVGDKPLPLEAGKVSFLEVTLKRDDLQSMRSEGGARPSPVGGKPKTPEAEQESPGPVKSKRGKRE